MLRHRGLRTETREKLNRAIELWSQFENVADVAREMGLTIRQCTVFLNKMRTRGFMQPIVPPCDRLREMSTVTERGCWQLPKESVGCNGYARYRFEGKQQLAHRISWQKSFGPIPDGLFVCHHCDNRLCVNPSHLFLGTHMDNMKDRDAKGRCFRPLGEVVGTSKLTESDVKEMRAMHAAGAGFAELGRRFGVSGTHAARIVRRFWWKHIA